MRQITVTENELDVTPERAVQLVALAEAQADVLARQGFTLAARRARRTAREWRGIAAQLLAQRGAQVR